MIATLIFLWILGCVTSPLWSVTETFFEVLIWPLLLIKNLLKTLLKTFFTGWK